MAVAATARLGQVAGTAQLMQPSPAVVAYAELLELPWAQLEERVDREVADNPALERAETSACLMCGGRSSLGARGMCWDCGGSAGPWESGVRRSERDRRGERGEGVAPGGWDAVAPVATGAEELLVDLRSTLPRGEGPIAAYLVACLDHRGLLTMSPQEAAERLGVAPDRVLAVVAAMRRLGPPGLAARNVRELLLLQLDAWEADHEPVPLVRAVVSGHLDGLAAGDLAGVAASTGATTRQVAGVLDFVREHLRPGAGIELSAGDPSAVLPPDVVIRPRPDLPRRFAVELTEPRRLGLSVRPIYRRLAADGAPSADDRVFDHAREQVRSATEFLSRLERRWQTLRAVAEHVVEVQREFLAKGPVYLVPLTRADVAGELGLHESTVSRAVSGRHALLPTRKVVPLAQFVSPSAGPRELLRQLIRSESSPLSDGELAAELAVRGFPVARRTVAKYRGQLAIPSAGRRRRP
jgi:RNA polymerase sigma-54 factor